MTNSANFDPYFDDEDDENEENYRQLLAEHATLPPCESTLLPFSSVSQRCALCSRVEAENILKTRLDTRPGNFIVRPSAHPNHPYSLSVLSNDRSVFHFQIGFVSNKYVMGPIESINDISKAKKYPSLSAFLEHYLISKFNFQDDKDKERSICLQLYAPVEVTRF